MASMEDLFGPVIYAYTRAQAIEDGALVDVSETAREAGFRWPVAVTAGVWHTWIAPEPMPTGQDVAGRLWDVLSLLRFAAPGGGDRIAFRVGFFMATKTGRPRMRIAQLVAVVSGEGPDGGPCITIMLPDED